MMGGLRIDQTALPAHLAPSYSAVGRRSIDSTLLIRILFVGYCFGIRSERRICEEVHLNLASLRFRRLGLDSDVPKYPKHSIFTKHRHGRFRESDLLRDLFDTVLRRCVTEGLVVGEDCQSDQGRG